MRCEGYGIEVGSKSESGADLGPGGKKSMYVCLRGYMGQVGMSLSNFRVLQHDLRRILQHSSCKIPPRTGGL